MEPICKLKDFYLELYQFEKKFSRENGITLNEAMVFCFLKDGTPKTAQQIDAFIGLSKSRISRILNTLEKKGFINRSIGQSDKRQMIFTLSTNALIKMEQIAEANKSIQEFTEKLKEII